MEQLQEQSLAEQGCFVRAGRILSHEMTAKDSTSWTSISQIQHASCWIKHYCLHFADNAEVQLLEHFMCPKTAWFVSVSLRTLLFKSHFALEKCLLIFSVVCFQDLSKMKKPKEFIDTSVACWALQRKGSEGNAAAGWSLQGKEIAFHFLSAARWWISVHLEKSRGCRISVQLWPSGRFLSLQSPGAWLGF